MNFELVKIVILKSDRKVSTTFKIRIPFEIQTSGQNLSDHGLSMGSQSFTVSGPPLPSPPSQLGRKPVCLEVTELVAKPAISRVEGREMVLKRFGNGY